MFDVVIIGGGPCGATAAEDLGKLGHKVALLDRPGRIKPCGGAVPPILISCLLYTSPSPRDMRRSRMPSSA